MTHWWLIDQLAQHAEYKLIGISGVLLAIGAIPDAQQDIDLLHQTMLSTSLELQINKRPLYRGPLFSLPCSAPWHELYYDWPLLDDVTLTVELHNSSKNTKFYFVAVTEPKNLQRGTGVAIEDVLIFDRAHKR